MGSGSVVQKQKKRVKHMKSKYLKPGALAQIRYSRSSSRDIGKKRILLNGPILPKTPKTPVEAAFAGDSRLESLPLDLLIKIVCNLHHDQLKSVFHVSKRIRTAVQLARQLYFNYTTPDRSRQELLLIDSSSEGALAFHVSHCLRSVCAAQCHRACQGPYPKLQPLLEFLRYEEELCEAVAQNKLL
ncbi:hypothetical protein QOZ80_UnG0729360 [Eleusine coracana subsp. coracana]|uniref:F-box domain-containing protein n=1 Tax=Eleusine coracana subsp. coracana TaxID=191504 RepID=A0AAV9FXW9_ELECO|nr:hypothetical protein QOZ80_UnG0729360 [Eleusine coracana subsp. coracana]